MQIEECRTHVNFPNKADVLKEMFPQIKNDQLMFLLSLFNGNIQKVITLCLEGFTTSTLLRVFKHSKMGTRVKRLAVDVNQVLHDALSFYKSSTFDVGRPMEVELVGSEALDLGGPRRHFF